MLTGAIHQWRRDNLNTDRLSQHGATQICRKSSKCSTCVLAYATKIRRVIVQKATKYLRVTSRKLQAFLAVFTVSVHESTIRRTLNISRVQGRVESKKATPLQKEHFCCLQFAQEHMNKPECWWKNVLWMDETKITLFSLTSACRLAMSKHIET